LSGNPSIFGADDAPAAVMPNGHVLLSADSGPSGFGSTGDITTGSNIITNIPSTDIPQVGWRVQGNGIPAGTFITGIHSESQVRISNAATTTIANDAIQWAARLALQRRFLISIQIQTRSRQSCRLFQTLTSPGILLSSLACWSFRLERCSSQTGLVSCGFT